MKQIKSRYFTIELFSGLKIDGKLPKPLTSTFKFYPEYCLRAIENERNLIIPKEDIKNIYMCDKNYNKLSDTILYYADSIIQKAKKDLHKNILLATLNEHKQYFPNNK